MKNKVFLLFFIIFTISFSAWKTIELIDDFGDKTGQVAMVNEVDFFQGMRLAKVGDKVVLDVMIGPQSVVGSYYPMKVKIDSGDVIKVETIAVSDRLLRLIVEEDFFDKLKKGNKASFVVYNTNGAAVNLRTSLIGFTKAFEKVKNSK